MGIGGGIFLIAIGAILTFAVQADPDWLNLNVVGWVLILAGLAVIALTWWFWRDRRRRGVTTRDQGNELASMHRALSTDPPGHPVPDPPPTAH